MLHAPAVANDSASTSDAARLGSRRDDWLTIGAMAVIVGFFAALLHEGLGHGLVAYLQGAKKLLLTNCYLDSDLETRAIDAAGTGVNLFFGCLAWLTLRSIQTNQLSVRYFLWLFMTVNLFQATGYFLYSGVSGVGDWAAFIHGLPWYWVLRVALALLGGFLYYGLVLPLSARWLVTILGSRESGPRLRRLTLVPYFVIGAADTIVALPNLIGWKMILISAAAASFGGLCGFLFLRGVAEKKLNRWDRAEEAPRWLHRNWVLIVLAVVLFTVNICVFGRGLEWQGHGIHFAKTRSAL